MADDRNSLLKFLTRRYTMDGLKTLSFNLFVDFDNLGGDTKNAKARELIMFLERRGRLDDLRAAVAREQPKAYEREFSKAPPVPTIPARPNRDPHQVFISHAHEDDDFAHKLAADLREQGWSIWIAPDSIRPGETWVESINRGLEESGTFVLVLTPAAVASPWVNTETNVAISLEHQRLMRFIPLDVAPCGPPPLWMAYQNVPMREHHYARGLQHLLARLDGRPPRPQTVADLAKDAQVFANRRLHDRSRIELMRVPAGEFTLGSDNADQRRHLPARPVHVPEFWIGRTPVTNAQFARFVEATDYCTTAEHLGMARVWRDGKWSDVAQAYWRRPEGPRSSIDERMHHPVVCVSWYDAQAFCEWSGLRLPMEREWEKAARGTDGRPYPWGSEAPAAGRTNYGAIDGAASAVGQYSPQSDSPYGVADMAGNVWEWTASWRDPSQRTRIVRGGAWLSDENAIQSTFRLDVDPRLRFNSVGFRVAISPGDGGF